MKTLSIVLIALGLAACGAQLNPNSTMYGARSYTGVGEKICQNKYRWLECDYRTPAEAAGE